MIVKTLVKKALENYIKEYNKKGYKRINQIYYNPRYGKSVFQGKPTTIDHEEIRYFIEILFDETLILSVSIPIEEYKIMNGITFEIEEQLYTQILEYLLYYGLDTITSVNMSFSKILEN